MERDDARLGHQQVERGILEGAAVVTFEQERRALALEEFATAMMPAVFGGVDGLGEVGLFPG